MKLMKILISPARKMAEPDTVFFTPTVPRFEQEAEQLRTLLAEKTPAQLMELYQCSDRTMRPVYEELQRQKKGIRRGGPALLSYQGLAFRYLGADVLEDDQWEYVQAHVRIVSGMYGILRPKDYILPYRLEMQSRPGFSLYDFWGSRIADALDDDVIVSLASKEYARAVAPYKNLITVRFLDVDENGRKTEPGAYAKMARGTMVRWMAEHNITDPAQICAFDLLRYRFSPEASDASTFVFEREKL